MTQDYTSKVPRFRFAATLAEQEAQCRDNPLLARFRESRKRLAADPYRPLYHFTSPESGLNDPNGLCFWQGLWHLFYQAFPPEDPRPHWGHAVSEDLVRWRDLPYAISPGPEEGCWSGATLVEPRRVIAMYHGHQLGNVVAVADDPLLLNWEKLTGDTVIPNACPIWEAATGRENLLGGTPPAGAINSVYDPCIWKQGDTYYSISGGCLPHGPSGRRLRNQFLYRSRDLATWEYLHPFIEEDIYGLPGDDGGCPYFWPIGDRHILLHFSHMSGGHYLLGDYDTVRQKFVVSGGGAFNFGAAMPAGVHAPTAAPDGKGGVIALFNMNPGKPTPGWDQIMTLPRRLTLSPAGDLLQEPAGNFATLRGQGWSLGQTLLPANHEVVLEPVRGNSLELMAEIDPRGAPAIEIDVLRSPGREEYTRITFYRGRGFVDWDRSGGWARYQESRDSLIALDTSRSSVLPDVECRAPEVAPVWLAPDEPLRLHVFLDKSVVEVFANGRQCLAVRAYPGRGDSLGVALQARGRDAMLGSLQAWPMAGCPVRAVKPY